jgi:hypothetical protein
MLGVALSVAAIIALEGRVTTKRIAVAAELCALALLTKQTLFAAPLAIALLLLWRRDLRALWFILAVVGAVGAITLAFSALSDGQYVRHVWLGNSTNPFRLDRMASFSWTFLQLNLIALGIGVWGLRRNWVKRGPSLVGIYALLALTTVLTIGNVSGDVNYFLEPTAALALLVPMAARWTPRPLYAALLCAQLAVLVHVPNGFMSQYPAGPAKGATPQPEDVAVGNRVLEVVRAGGPRSLVEPAGFAVLAGVPVWLQPLDLVAEQRQGRWEADALVRSIESREWTVVVLNYKFFPREALAALDRAYELTDGLASPDGFSYFVYRPRP